MSESQNPIPEPVMFPVHNRLFFRLFQAGNTLARQVSKEVGVSTVQWAVLGALSRPQASSGMLFSRLADYLVVSRQNLDGVVKRLERDGYVTRVPDALDGRARRVQLTPLGREFWEGLQERIHAFYRQAAGGLAFDDLVALLHHLNRLNDGMSRVDLAASAEPGDAMAAEQGDAAAPADVVRA